MTPHTTATSEKAIEFEIGGMTCAACSGRVAKVLNRIDGVTATVNLATERATVRGLAPAQSSVAIKAITDIGYTATLHEDDTADNDDLRHARLGALRTRLIAAALLTLPLSNLTIVLGFVPGLRFPGWQWVCVALAIPVVVWCAAPFHRAAWRNLRHRGTSMDTLVSLGVISSFVLALGGLVSGADTVQHSLYLEVAAAVTTFMLAGRYFEARARRGAADVLGALNALVVREARVLGPDGHRMTPIADIAPGETVLVYAGESFPVDGTVTGGTSMVDTSTMSGEALPVRVSDGGAVVAGTVNLTGRLAIRVDAVGRDTQLSQLARLADEAQSRKAAIDKLVDRVVAIFVPVVIGIAFLTLAGWMIAGANPSRAIEVAITVLIVACPCAMGLATPTAMMVGVGRGSMLGILIKGHDALEASGAIDTVVFDKTGTITTGEMTVISFDVDSGIDVDDLLAKIAALETASSHPIAKAIVRFAADRAGLRRGIDVTTAEEDPAGGIHGTVDGSTISIGNDRFLTGRQATRLDTTPYSALAPSDTAVGVAIDGMRVARLVFSDPIKPSAASAIAELHSLGMRTILLTGDQTATAEHVAQEVGIAEVIAEVSPAGKSLVVEDLQSRGSRVAMIGDGINDAAALATANLGLAIPRGTDVSLKAADIILMRRDLQVIPDAIRLSRDVRRTIRWNLIWAFGYNTAAIPLAILGLINPLIAGFAMSLSSIFVVGNSLRLQNFVSSRPSGAPRDQP